MSSLLYSIRKHGGTGGGNWDYQLQVEEEYEDPGFENEEELQDQQLSASPDEGLYYSMDSYGPLNSEVLRQALSKSLDNRGYNILHYTCSQDHQLTQSLLERGIDYNLQDKDGNTPIIHCVLQFDVEGALYLIENGADPNIQNHFGETALHLSCASDT